jgi:SPP1 family predicted phage head-tail adaptor
MTKPPAIGAMNRRLVLEYAQRKPDGAGGFSTTWFALADLWAHIETPSGTETFEAGGVKGRLMHTVITRARTEIVPSRRFREGSSIFDIQAVQSFGDSRDYLICRCEQRGL